MRPTAMKVSLGTLENNARLLRASIPENVKMMCVVKADAYGHGAPEAAGAMLKGGASAFAVAIAEEAAQLRSAGISLPLLILGGASEESLRSAVRLNTAQAVYSKDMLSVMQEEAGKLGCFARAHLKIDTGMTRIGVRTEEELAGLIAHAKDHCPNVRIEGIFTHFCAADSDEEFTRRQNDLFARALEIVRSAGFRPAAHAAATSAMMLKEYQYDMVRAGICLYGPYAEVSGGSLQYAQTLVTRPVRIELIHAGDTVGYSRTFAAARDTLVMTLPVGYGDGYPRLLSNRAQVLVNGQRANVIGNVCMDMMTVDVTEIEGVSLNSEVVLMGAQGKERITPDELAQKSETIPYEIMLGFSKRVPKVYSI